MEVVDVKYVVCGKSDRAVDAYVAPYIRPVRSDASINDLKLMLEALKVKSGFEWKIILRDIDANGKFIPIDTLSEFDRSLPTLSNELYQYTKTMTLMLGSKNNKLPPYNRDLIGDKTPALVYAMLLTGGKEYLVAINVDVYWAFAEACKAYYGDYNTLPWGIKRAIASNTTQLHIRLCTDSEMSYARCMAAVKTHEIKITPIMDCVDVTITMQETSKFIDILADKFGKFAVGARNEPTRTPATQGHKLGTM
ncbi:hypothetical protein F-VV10_0159 [Faustovirus]|nr:hypothetical protein F-VV10_0159 [Faustovirus]